MRVPLILSALFVTTLAVASDQSDAKVELVARQDRWGKNDQGRDWGKNDRGGDWDRDWDDNGPNWHGGNHRPPRPHPRPHPPPPPPRPWPRPPPPPPRPNVCKKYYALCHKQWDQCQIDDTPPTRGPLFDFTPVTRYAIMAPTCNPFYCLPVIAVAPCILTSVARGDPVMLMRCAAPEEICHCNDCVPGLNNFLHRYGLCRYQRDRNYGKDNGKNNGKDNGKNDGKNNGKNDGKSNGKNVAQSFDDDNDT